MSANFSPTFTDYTDLKPFRFWCQKVLPAIYDDSLSYYELLTKVVKVLNDVIENMEGVEENTTALLQAFNQLQSYVNSYFDSADFAALVDTSLDKMARNGTLDELLIPIVGDNLGDVVSEQIDDVVASMIGDAVLDKLPEAIDELSSSTISDTVNEWLEENVTPVGSAVVVDSSLSVEGAAADAKVTGVNIDNLKKLRSTPTLTWRKGIISSAGVISDSNYTRYTDIVRCNSGDLIINNTPATDANNVYFLMYLVLYNDDTFVSRVGISSSPARTQVIPNNVNGFRFLFGRQESSGVTFVDADLNYWDVEYYLASPSYESVEALSNRVSILEEYSENFEPEMFAYTNYQETEGYWRADGTMQSTTLTHTELLKIIPNKKFYMGTIANQEIIGAFFDKNKEWIAPMRTSEAVVISWSPNKGSGSMDFADIYEITPPANCYYISINLRVATHSIRQSVCSKPVMLYNAMGNMSVSKNEIISNVGNKKLCIIGASTAMIDRMYSSALSQYLCGWAEYIGMWYKDYEIYGYNGGSMGSGYTTYISIYDGIVGENVDLSGFDDFIILNTKNGLTTTGVGDWGSITEAPSEHSSYMGGLRNIVEYIYQQNPKANIYLTTMQYDARYFNNPTTYRPLVDSVNEKTKEMGEKLGIPVIDLAANSGFNYNTYYKSNDVTAGYTYDGTHFNQDGNYQIGKCVRKTVLGF